MSDFYQTFSLKPEGQRNTKKNLFYLQATLNEIFGTLTRENRATVPTFCCTADQSSVVSVKYCCGETY